MTKTVRPIRHRGLVLRPYHDGYLTTPEATVRVEVYRSTQQPEWIASVHVGDTDDATGEHDTIASAIDTALCYAEDKLDDAIRSLTAERARIRKVLRAKP